MDIPDIKTLKQGQFSKSSIEKNFPDFYNFIIDKYNKVKVGKFSELIYLYFHNMNEPPTCPICGKQLSLINYSRGYRKYCSVKCKCKDENYKIKVKQSIKDKYGVENYAKTDEFKKRVRKTCLEKYGVINPSQVEKFKNKRKQTNINKYGTEHPQKLSVFEEKSKQTCLEKYGEEYV